MFWFVCFCDCCIYMFVNEGIDNFMKYEMLFWWIFIKLIFLLMFLFKCKYGNCYVMEKYFS